MDSTFYKTLYLDHPDPMWVFDASTLEFLSVNRAAVEKYGYSEAEFLELTLRDIRPAEDLSQLQRVVEDYADRPAETGVWRHLTKHGKLLYVDVRTRPLDFNGRKAKLVSARDVSAQVQLEIERADLVRRERESRQAAEAAATWFQSLFEALPGKFLVLRPGDWEVITVSDAYLEATMTTREALKGRLLFDAFPTDPAEPEADGSRNLRASLMRVEAAGVSDIMPIQRYPIPRPEALGGGFEERYWICINTPVRGPEGELVCIVHRAEDVTDYVRGRGQATEQELDHQQAQLELDVTLRAHELAEANARLLQQDLQFRNARRLVKLGTWELDLGSGQLAWSSEIYEIFGVTPEAFGHTADAFMALVHPDDLDLLKAAQQRGLELGEPFDFIHRVLRPDGTVRVVREVAEVVESVKGPVLAGVVLDITEQREAEFRLQETLESMTDGFFTLDSDWRFRFINSEFTRIMGVERDALLGRHVWDCFPEAKGTQFQRGYEEAVSTGKALSFAEYLPGYDMWLRVRAYPGPDGLAVYFQDVTQEHRQEEAARISQERFAYIAKATYDAVWDWDLATDKVWWNDSFRVLTGYEPDSSGGSSRTWTDHIHPEDKERVLEGIHKVIAGSSSNWRDEYRYLRADGHVLTLIDRGFVIRDAAGKPLRMVGSMVDVTENRELALKLQQSQKLESIGQLTGGIAHDFNNLLTVIQGSAEMLEESLAAEPGLQRMVQMISHASQRGAELTGRLLAFARRQVLEPKVVDVSRLLSGMDALLRRVLHEDITIEVVRGGGLWPVEVDPGQLEVALLNLAINARDAMPQGGCLTIETANAWIDDDYVQQNQEAVAGQYVMVSVTDTGCGMPQPALARAFEPFFTTKEAGKGSGLGLSMVYGFVKQSGGHARIYSETGEGTTVRLYFPRLLREEAKPEPTSVAEVASVVGGDESILLVEDDDNVRNHVELLLQSLGYRVVCAADGAAALDILQGGEHFDLLFTDVVMPGDMSGKVLADRARELRPEMKVLFTSGYTQNAIVHHGRLDPGVELLSKPYRKAQLAAKLRKVLDVG